MTVKYSRIISILKEYFEVQWTLFSFLTVLILSIEQKEGTHEFKIDFRRGSAFLREKQFPPNAIESNEFNQPHLCGVIFQWAVVLFTKNPKFFVYQQIRLSLAFNIH